MNKKVEILSGNFTTAGNYSAYDDEGTRYFVPKRLMEAHGWTTDTEVKTPFFAKAGTRTIGQLDADNQVVVGSDGRPVTVDREQILSIFKTREELILACVNKASLEIEIASAISAKATTAGLTQTQLDALLHASIV